MGILTISEERGKLPSQFGDLGKWLQEEVPGLLVVSKATAGARPKGEVSFTYSYEGWEIVKYGYDGLDMIADMIRYKSS